MCCNDITTTKFAYIIYMYIVIYQGDYTATFITCSYNMLFIILRCLVELPQITVFRLHSFGRNQQETCKA